MRQHRSLAVWVLVFLSLAASPANACRKVYMISAILGPRSAFMLATSTADTLLAGVGVTDGPVYGQVMTLDSSTGPGARSSSRVVLVPWGTGADCRPARWKESARWRPAGTGGLYSGILRDSAEWAGGIPTYDVFSPEAEPYVARPASFRALLSGTPASDVQPLSPLELFNAARHFVWERGLGEVREHEAFLQWLRENPDIAKRDPLPSATLMVVYDTRLRLLHRLPMPLAGTYRYVVTVDGKDSVVAYARTYAHPVLYVDRQPLPSGPGAGDMTYVDPITHYLMMVAFAGEPGAIHPSSSEAMVTLPVASSRSLGGTRRWTGSWDAGSLAKQFPPGAVVDALDHMPELFDATFAVNRHGKATIEHRSRLPDGREVRIRAVRVSAVAIPFDH